MVENKRELRRSAVLTDDTRSEQGITLRVWLFGEFRVSVGALPVEEKRWRLRRASALIKLLALAPEHRLHREQATGLLWPSLDTPSALNNLHNVLYVARRALQPAPGVPSSHLCLRNEWLTLCPYSPLWVDVEAFEEAAAGARRLHEPAAYRAALELYAGELLPEDRYEEWAQERRSETRTLHLTLLAELAAIHEAEGELGAATETLQEILLQEPAHETAHAGLMRLHAAAGQRCQALRQYEQLKKALRRDLGAEPESASKRLYERILAGHAPSAIPPPAGREPPRRTEPRRHNLPAALTSFIGREREIAEVESALQSSRLLTLTGTGGVGKTRLALQAAKKLAGEYPDGVWLAELASLSEPDLVPQTVAAVLSVREQPGHPLTDTLANALRNREMLLVLDNCEHLVEEASRLVRSLLDACPRLRVLATSREVLGIAGETVRLVRSLSLPGAERGAPADSESARLFAERVRCRWPEFEMTGENARIAGEICRRLDGVPLAVELAAARAGVLTLAQICTRLDDTLGLLTDGDRTATPRQQTLRATLDWSHDLLDERERALFERLPVFAGGFSLEAAEAVCAGGGIGSKDVLDLLGRLVYKSLVIVEIPSEGAPRYGMLEPVRQYALERLRESGREDAARQRHADWCLDLTRRAEPKLSGPDQPQWLALLETEQDNLRAALSYSLDAEKPELGLGLAVSQQLFWHTRGLRDEGRGWLERAARNSGSTTTDKAKALYVAAHMAAYQGDIEAARSLADEASSLPRQPDDGEGMAYALVVRGFIAALGQEDPEIALALEEEAVSLRSRIRDRRVLAFLLQFSGVIAVVRDDWERATALHEEALELFRETRDATNVSVCLINLGLMAIEQADYERAIEALRKNLRVSSEADKAGIMHTLAAMAVATAALGRTARAARLWAAAKKMREIHGLRLVPMPRRRIRHDEWLAHARSQLDEAAWETAWTQGKAMSQQEAAEYALSDEERAATEQPSGSAQRLTRREREVALLISGGLTNRQIAGRLVISERTVENHVARILRKLDFRSRARIATWIAEQPLS